jgi:transposase InsO family protein
LPNGPFIGEIHPSSSKGHRFVLVATDYFTKWTEAVALKNMTHKEVIEFITEHIIHRFGIPQTLTTDQGTSFMSKEVREFAELYRIKLLNSSPYYAQANGQAESSNRTLINLIKRRYLIILNIGIRFCLKLYELIEYLNIGLLKYLLLSLSMGKKQCCLWK